MRTGKYHVLRAIMLREVRVRFAARRLGYLWALFEPLVHIAVFMVIFHVVGRTSPVDENIEVFFGTGIVPWLLFKDTVSRVAQTVNANKALLVYPHVYPVDFMFGRILLEAATGFTVAFVLLTAAWFFYGFVPQDPLGMMMALAVIALLGGGLGMVNCALLSVFPSYENFYKPVQRLLYFLSGIFFIISDLPLAAQQALAWNPMLHGIDWFRSATLPGYHSTFYQPWPLLGLALALFLTGMMAERLQRKETRAA